MLIQLSEHIYNKYCNYFHIIRIIITIILVWLKLIKLIYFNVQYSIQGWKQRLAMEYGIYFAFGIGIPLAVLGYLFYLKDNSKSMKKINSRMHNRSGKTPISNAA